MIVRVTWILLLVNFIILVAYISFRSNTTPDVFDCSGNVELKIDSARLGLITGEVKIDAHISKVVNGVSYVSQIGFVKLSDRNYNIDRNVRLSVNEKNKDGFSEFHRIGIDKNPEDTLPDFMDGILTSSQMIFFYKFETIYGDIVRWSDLRRTILVCKITP
ncbi:hypothetical protein ACTZGH_22400 [Enterobacter ludwigii]|uniref:hypothetical protein n=1 Tax=Enterobacter ludwigii TaxID=299767 RepID=UPI003FD53B57